ncbi:MAG TPA: hypothetical protein PLS49_03455, partial [Candidatus Woesebacteria bacterium]|nr:hypothetical protein [Candidatus Woesebacteria bacterium]
MIDRIKRFFRSISQLPDKKKYIEFITAILSIPVLLSVILLNYSNLQNQHKSTEEPKEPTPAVITIIRDRDNDNTTNPTQPIITETECSAEVGPVSIAYPEAGETINENPLSIVINQNDPDNKYCAIVWSYRINGGAWSNFDDRDISIYNMESGDKKLDVRFKSLISGKEETISRTFYY